MPCRSWRTRPRRWGWAIKGSRYTAVLDACVLFSAPLRDLLMELAAARAFHARWTDAIQDEWVGNLLRARPELNPSSLARTQELMSRAVPDCLLTGYDHLVVTLDLPDSDDRHVLAAAIVGGADAIVTFNLADFPSRQLLKHGVEALHPDDFLSQCFEQNPAAVLSAARNCRTRLRRPPMSADDYLTVLERQSLAKCVRRLRSHSAII